MTAPSNQPFQSDQGMGPRQYTADQQRGGGDWQLNPASTADAGNNLSNQALDLAIHNRRAASDQGAGRHYRHQQGFEDPIRVLQGAGSTCYHSGFAAARPQYERAVALSRQYEDNPKLNQDRMANLEKWERSGEYLDTLRRSGASYHEQHLAKEYHQLLAKEQDRLDYLYDSPGITRANMGIAALRAGTRTGNLALVREGEQLLGDALRMRPGIADDPHLRKHMLQAARYMEHSRNADIRANGRQLFKDSLHLGDPRYHNRLLDLAPPALDARLSNQPGADAPLSPGPARSPSRPADAPPTNPTDSRPARPPSAPADTPPAVPTDRTPGAPVRPGAPADSPAPPGAPVKPGAPADIPAPPGAPVTPGAPADIPAPPGAPVKPGTGTPDNTGDPPAQLPANIPISPDAPALPAVPGKPIDQTPHIPEGQKQDNKHSDLWWEVPTLAGSALLAALALYWKRVQTTARQNSLVEGFAKAEPVDAFSDDRYKADKDPKTGDYKVTGPDGKTEDVSAKDFNKRFTKTADGDFALKSPDVVKMYTATQKTDFLDANKKPQHIEKGDTVLVDSKGNIKVLKPGSPELARMAKVVDRQTSLVKDQTKATPADAISNDRFTATQDAKTGKFTVKGPDGKSTTVSEKEFNETYTKSPDFATKGDYILKAPEGVKIYQATQDAKFTDARGDKQEIKAGDRFTVDNSTGEIALYAAKPTKAPDTYTVKEDADGAFKVTGPDGKEHTLFTADVDSKAKDAKGNPIDLHKGDTFIINEKNGRVVKVFTADETARMKADAAAVQDPADPVDGQHPADPADAQHPADPADAQHPANPADAQHPANPADAQHPANPADAQHPANPADAQHPANPADAQHPANPADAQHPANPADAQHPANPADAQHPANPADAQHPANPADAQHPANPADAQHPANPADAQHPANPADAQHPANPADAQHPANPADAQHPANPADAQHPANPADAQHPANPADAQHPANPADAQHPANPADAQHPANPADAQHPANPADAQHPATPADLAAPRSTWVDAAVTHAPSAAVEAAIATMTPAVRAQIAKGGYSQDVADALDDTYTQIDLAGNDSGFTPDQRADFKAFRDAYHAGAKNPDSPEAKDAAAKANKVLTDTLARSQTPATPAEHVAVGNGNAGSDTTGTGSHQGPAVTDAHHDLVAASGKPAALDASVGQTVIGPDGIKGLVTMLNGKSMTPEGVEAAFKDGSIAAEIVALEKSGQGPAAQMLRDQQANYNALTTPEARTQYCANIIAQQNSASQAIAAGKPFDAGTGTGSARPGEGPEGGDQEVAADVKPEGGGGGLGGLGGKGTAIVGAVLVLLVAYKMSVPNFKSGGDDTPVTPHAS